MFSCLLVLFPVMLGGGVQSPDFPNRAHTFNRFYDPLIQVDLDGDGTEELVGLAFQEDELHVFPQIPGGWGSRATVSLPAQSQTFAARDMTGDGELDLVVLHSQPLATRSVSVLVGVPGGGYAQPVTTLLGMHGDFQTGDVDGDGVPDLVLALGNLVYATTLTVMLGDGAGGFGAPYELPMTPAPRLAQPAQLDGTPALEIVVTKGYVLAPGMPVEVFRFSRSTGFTSIGSLSAPPYQHPVQVADLNADGFDDLVAVGKDLGFEDTIWSRLGQGDGSFAPETEVACSIDYARLVDLDRDGFLDLVSGYQFARGNGTSSFAAPFTLGFSAESSGRTLLSRDMNEDGILDLLQVGLTYGQSMSLTELRGRPDGSYELDAGLLGSSPSRPVSAVPDMNGDGLDDVALIRNDPFTPTIRASFSESDGQGGFGPRYGLVHPLGCALAASPLLGDFDGDGRGDLILASNCDTTLYLQRRSRQFDAGIASIFGGPFHSRVVDFDGDGRDDVLANSQVLFGEVDGLSAGPTVIVDTLRARVGDIDGDGLPDVVNPLGGTALEIWFARADRTFVGPIATDLPFAYDSLQAVADFDEDGSGDLAVLESPTDLRILLGQGDGSFVEGRRPALPRRTLDSIQAGDLNADGHVDLFGGKRVFVVMTGRGDGTFLEPKLFGYRTLGPSGAVFELARHRLDQVSIHYRDGLGFNGFVKQSRVDAR